MLLHLFGMSDSNQTSERGKNSGLLIGTIQPTYFKEKMKTEERNVQTCKVRVISDLVGTVDTRQGTTGDKQTTL